MAKGIQGYIDQYWDDSVIGSLKHYITVPKVSPVCSIPSSPPD